MMVYNVFQYGFPPCNLIKKDKIKIESASCINSIIVIILSKEMITEEVLKSLFPSLAHGEQVGL